MSVRKFLTEAEVVAFLKAARKGRNGIRDHCLMTMIFRHGLRASEAIKLKLEDLDLDGARVYVRRVKGSLSTQQPIDGDELRAIKAWIRQRGAHAMGGSPWLFLSERGPMTRQALNYLCGVIGERAGLGVDVHPHMLRHSCGYALADRNTSTRIIQDYLGHKNIQNTVKYTATNAGRFAGLWGKQ